MKVLVLSGAAYGDPSRRKVLDHVARCGVEVTLALPRIVNYPFLPPGEVPDTPWQTPGVHLVKLDLWRQHANDTHIIASGLAQLIKTTKPDLIHCALEPWSVMCLQALAAARGIKPRPVFGVQACETKPEHGGAVARVVRQRLYRGVLARTDFFIGWSTPVMRAATRMGMNGQVTCVTPGVGVDPEEFRPLDGTEREMARREIAGGLEGAFAVGYAGRLVSEKGLFDLVSAMDKVTAMRPSVRLVLVGDGPARERLVALGRSRPWLTIAPKRGRVDMARFLGSIDLFVLASRTTPSWEEQFGMVLTEAMSAGLPVIGSSCGAIPEVVGDGGWIFPEGDVDSLSRLIVHAADSAAELQQKSLAARSRAQAQFSDECVAARLIETWRRATPGAAS